MNLCVLTNFNKENCKGLLDTLYDSKSLAELKKAYYALMLIHHPDRGGDVVSAQLINEKYHELKERY